jgi:quercetin dioxygenase-like cupin family protein
MSRQMIYARSLAILSVCALTATVWVRADTMHGDLPQRQELKRADLSSSPDMEVITSVSEFRKGETIPRHSHHGIETGYVLQGSMVQLPGKAATMMVTGSSFMNLRDVPHAGFTVVGDQPLKLLTVHVVDKNKPLYEWEH